MAVRAQLVLLRYLIVLRTKSKTIWESQWTGRLFLWVALDLIVYWYFRVPPVGYSVVAMTVAAGIMALRSEISPHQKWFWLACLFALAFIEIRAINHDKDVRDKAQALRDKAQQYALQEERQNFAGIGGGIRDAIQQSQQQFNQTISDNQRKFEATMGRTQQIVRSTEKTADTASHAVEALTGGKSYPLAGISYNPQDMSRVGLYGLFVGKRETDAGSFRYDVSKMESTHVRPFEPAGVCFAPYFKETGGTFSGDSSAIYQVPAQLWNVILVPSTDGLINHYRINMRTKTNGQFVECLDIKASSCLGNFHWDTRTTVWRSDSFVVYSEDWPKCN